MHILTIDLEEWFHINDSTLFSINDWWKLDSRILEGTTVILEFLERHNIKSTFFVVGWIAEMYPGLVKSIFDSGHQIGYHSWKHTRPFRQIPEEFHDDLHKGLNIIADITGSNAIAYRAPNFSLNKNTQWAYKVLIENGIKVSSSIKQGQKLGQAYAPGVPFIIRSPDGQLVEFPLCQSYKTTFSGSGYFRLCPSVLLEQLYRRDYTMTYFHPRDFDVHFTKELELGYIRNWMHKVGNATTIPKLDKLATNKTFISIEKALKHINLDKLEVIDIQ